MPTPWNLTAFIPVKNHSIQGYLKLRCQGNQPIAVAAASALLLLTIVAAAKPLPPISVVPQTMRRRRQTNRPSEMANRRSWRSQRRRRSQGGRTDGRTARRKAAVWPRELHSCLEVPSVSAPGASTLCHWLSADVCFFNIVAQVYFQTQFHDVPLFFFVRLPS